MSSLQVIALARAVTDAVRAQEFIDATSFYTMRRVRAGVVSAGKELTKKYKKFPVPLAEGREILYTGIC